MVHYISGDKVKCFGQLEVLTRNSGDVLVDFTLKVTKTDAPYIALRLRFPRDREIMKFHENSDHHVVLWKFLPKKYTFEHHPVTSSEEQKELLEALPSNLKAKGNEGLRFNRLHDLIFTYDEEAVEPTGSPFAKYSSSTAEIQQS